MGYIRGIKMNYDVMKPKKIDTIPLNNENNKYIYEIKYDGGSGIIVKQNSHVDVFHNGNSTPVTYRYPELITELQMNLQDGIYVAELIVSTSDMIGGDFDLFQKRQVENRFKIERRKNLYPITAIIYDILQDKNENIRDLTLFERKQILHKNVCDSEHIRVIESFNKPEPILEKQDIYEGIVIKDLNSIYQHGKRNGWYKYRFNHEEIVRFVDFEETQTGIVLLTEENKRVNLAGRRSEIAKEKIRENGYVDCEIAWNKKTDKGFRFCIVKRIIAT